MDSSTSRLEAAERNQIEIRRQIALLQAQLVDVPSQAGDTPLPTLSPKRKQPEETCLAPATPSPKKRKLDRKGPSQSSSRHLNRPSGSSAGPRNSSLRTQSINRTLVGSHPETQPVKPAPSNVIAKLAGLNNPSKDVSPMDNVVRSSGFSDKPTPQPVTDMDVFDAPKRDDRLALVEDIEIGPADFKPPFDDPHFKQLEPNSGIRLSSRIVPHDDVQEYLTGRFYLSPSRMYSTIRLLPNKQGYDVPVSGDWVTIAVVAERGPIKFSQAPVGIGRDEGAVDGEEANELVGDGSGRFKFEESKRPSKAKWKGSAPSKPSGKKYVNLKLVDFGARSRSASSSTGGKATIRGDAFLTLLLFESDGFDKVTRADGGRVEKIYKGGSRGAFEAMSKLKEGDVVALLNPKVLKPLKRDNPHPTDNILAVTPESASSITVLGRARDLGMCQVAKKDGKVCGGWCDKRVSDVCDYHVQRAVERQRASRPEFSISTSGMSTSSKPSRKPAYDPVRQWGLKPEPSSGAVGGSATYVVSGHVVGGSSSDSRSLYVAETMGREGQAKAKRKFAKDSEKELKSLLERDKPGMKAVVRAIEVAKLMDKKNRKQEKRKGKEKEANKSNTRVKGKAIRRTRSEGSNSDSDSDLVVEDPNLASTQKNAYSAKVIQQLGFDPAVKPGQKRAEDSAIQKKAEALAAVLSSRKEIELGPRPGQRTRSSVVAPPDRPGPVAISNTIPAHLTHDSDDEFEEEMIAFGKPALLNEEMIDLDSSSDVEDHT